MSNKTKWEHRVIESLIDSAKTHAGAMNFACIVATLLRKGYTLSYGSLFDILSENLDRANEERNHELYAELLLAIAFFNDASLDLNKHSNDIL